MVARSDYISPEEDTSILAPYFLFGLTLTLTLTTPRASADNSTASNIGAAALALKPEFSDIEHFPHPAPPSEIEDTGPE